jgi:UDP-glucose 4-epimerase
VKVAVIGAGGFVGRHLCCKLAAQGDEVLAFSAGLPRGISVETGLFPFDFTLPHGVEAVYFLAQSPRYHQMPDQSAHLLSVNCVAAVQAAEAARKANVARFIYASTGNVYAPSFFPLPETSPVRRDNWYSLSKVMAEDSLGLFLPHLNVTIARIFGVYGPRQEGKFVSKLAESVRLRHPVYADRNPHNSRDVDGFRISLIYIDDLVDSLVKLLPVTKCKILNLSGPEAVSIRLLAIRLGKFLDRQPNISLGRGFREGDLIADTSKYCTLFPLTRFVSLDEGLRRVVESVST